MTCRQFADFIAGYLSGELPPDTRDQFEYHLRICENCRVYVANYRQALAVGRQAFGAGDDPLPDDVPNELVKAILAARPK